MGWFDNWKNWWYKYTYFNDAIKKGDLEGFKKLVKHYHPGKSLTASNDGVYFAKKAMEAGQTDIAQHVIDLSFDNGVISHNQGRDIIKHAVYYNNPKIVQSLKLVDSERGNFFASLALQAVQRKNSDMALLLLERDNSKFTPSQFKDIFRNASYYNDLKVAQEVLNRKAIDLNANKDFTSSLILEAVKGKNSDMALLLLGPSLEGLMVHQIKDIFRNAAYYGDLKVVKHLLDHKAIDLEKNKDFVAWLTHEAAKRKNWDIASLLLKGSVKHLKPNQIKDILRNAAYSNQHKIVENVLEEIDLGKNSHLLALLAFEATERKNTDMALLLLKSAKNLSVDDQLGILKSAAAKGNLKVAQNILERKDYKLFNNEQESLAFVVRRAVRNNQTDIALLLLNSEIKVRNLDDEGYTRLSSIAREVQNYKVLAKLIAKNMAEYSYDDPINEIKQAILEDAALGPEQKFKLLYRIQEQLIHDRTAWRPVVSVVQDMLLQTDQIKNIGTKWNALFDLYKLSSNLYKSSLDDNVKKEIKQSLYELTINNSWNTEALKDFNAKLSSINTDNEIMQSIQSFIGQKLYHPKHQEPDIVQPSAPPAPEVLENPNKILPPYAPQESLELEDIIPPIDREPAIITEKRVVTQEILRQEHVNHENFRIEETNPPAALNDQVPAAGKEKAVGFIERPVGYVSPRGDHAKKERSRRAKKSPGQLDITH